MKNQDIYNGASVQLGSNSSTPFHDGGVNEANARGIQQVAANLAGLGEQVIRMEDFSQEQKDETTLATEAQNFDLETERRLALPDGHSDSFYDSDGTLRQNKITSLVSNYRKKFEPLGSKIIDPERRMQMQARAQHTIDSMGGALISRGAKETKRKALINYQNNRDLALQRGDYAGVRDMDSRAVDAALIPQSQADLQAYELEQAEYVTIAQNAWQQSPEQLAALWDEGQFDSASPEVQRDVENMLKRAGGMKIDQPTTRRVKNKDGTETVEKVAPEAPRGLPSYLVQVWNENGGSFKTPDARDTAMPLLASWARSQITSPNNPQEVERVKTVMKAYGASDGYASAIVDMYQKDLGAGREFDPSDSWEMMDDDAVFTSENQEKIESWKAELENPETSSIRTDEIKEDLKRWERYREAETVRAKSAINGEFEIWRASNPNADYRAQFEAFWNIKDRYFEASRDEEIDHRAMDAYKIGDYVAKEHADEILKSQEEMRDAKEENDADVKQTELMRNQGLGEIQAEIEAQRFSLTTTRGASNTLAGNTTEAILYVPKGAGLASKEVLIRAEGDIASYARVVETDKVSSPTMSLRLRGNLGDYTGQNKTITISGSNAYLSTQSQPKTNMNNMQKLIINSEARRDKQGRIQVYNLPSGDGGGSYEVAGINQRYHPKQAARLKSLIESGRHEQAEEEAATYITEYTQPVQDFLASAGVENAGIEYYLRDIYFNGGQGGAAKVLNRSLGLKGSKFTKETRDMLSSYVAENGDDGLLDLLRDTRAEWYKGIAAHNPSKRKFLKGWLNRTNATYSNAQTLV